MSSSMGFTKVHNMSILAGASSSAWERDTRDPAATIAAARYSGIIESVNTRTSRELTAPISVLASAGLSPREPSHREVLQPRAITPSSPRRPATASQLPIPNGFTLPNNAPSVVALPGYEGPYATMGEPGGSARKTVRINASDNNNNNYINSSRASGFGKVAFDQIEHSGPPTGAGVGGGVFSGTRTSFGPTSPASARRDERGPNLSAAAVATGMIPIVEVETTSLTRALSLVDAGNDMRWGSLSLRAKSPLRGSRNTGSLGDQLVREGVLRDELGYLRLENERLRKELDAERRARIEAQARSPIRWVDQRVAQRSGTSQSVAMRDSTTQRSVPQQHDDDENSLRFDQASEDGEFGAVIVHAQHAETVSKALHRSSSPSQMQQKDVVVNTALAAASSSLSPRTSRSPQETGSLLVEKCLQGDAAGAAALVEFADLVDMDVTFDCDSLIQTTPLIWACSKGHERLAILLADRGADLTAISGNGDTALSAAIKKGLQEASLVLINKGSDILHMDRVRGDGGQSLLEYCYRRPLGMARVAQRLTELGAAGR